MTGDGLPPLREVIARHGLDAKKSLGQNFLCDLNLTRRIARQAAPLDGFTIVEIGPGPGGLTRALLMEGATRIIAVERDPRALPALDEIARAYPRRLTVIAADALDPAWTAEIAGPAKIVANLPYNIATPLLTGWLSPAGWPPWFTSLTLMFQREVAERLAAPPGGKSYGRLSVLAQWRCSVHRLFDIHPSAFVPAPSVVSSLVQLVPKPAVGPAPSPETLARVTAAAFGQRRKMLRQSLKTLGGDPLPLLARAGIAPELRAEQLSVADFARLAHLLEN